MIGFFAFCRLRLVCLFSESAQLIYCIQDRQLTVVCVHVVRNLASSGAHPRVPRAGVCQPSNERLEQLCLRFVFRPRVEETEQWLTGCWKHLQRKWPSSV